MVHCLVQFYIKNGKDTLERIQHSATRIILPDVTYEERLAHLSIPVLNDFICECYKIHSNKNSKDENHPLYSRIGFEQSQDIF